MQTIFILILLLTHPSHPEPDHDKNRRGANMGLYAFPRVGRSDPSLVNNLHDASDSMAYEAIYGMSEDAADDFDGKLNHISVYLII